MNSDSGYENSLVGFIDYTSAMESASSGIWQAIGYLICVGTVISLIPQIYSLVKRRSSYGMNPITLFVTNISQYLLVFNIVCLKTTDFIAINQVNFFKILPRLMTFFNAFFLWVVYLPIIFLTTLYFDKEPRKVRSPDTFRRELFFNRMFTLFNVGGSVLIMFIFFILAFFTGIGSAPITTMGKTFGTITLMTVIVQYMPQFYTTCKLRDNGSFSLLLLALQAPGGSASAMFMCFGQGDHWSTWMSTLAASIQQFCLLFLCLFFKWQRWRRKRAAPMMGNDKSATTPALLDPMMFEKSVLD